jgi:DNA polymerase elongation subunit (family B)
MPEPKILTIDIETAPNLAYVWGLWDQNVALNQLVQESTILCFAAKWLNEKKTNFYSLPKDGPEGMIEAAYELLDQADVVVGFNHRSFDIKHLNREFILSDRYAPSYYANIDLLTIARSKFKFASNKLEHIAAQLQVGKKMKNSGFELWLGCMAGTIIPNTELNPIAWAEMEKYNRQDVKVTEAAYLKMRNWDTSNVHLGVFAGNADACRVCAGRNLEKRGFKAKGSSVYQQYQCRDCGAWSRAASAIKSDEKPTTRAL